MRDNQTTIFLGLLHGLTDASTAFILFSQSSIKQTLELYIFYNLIAFALQPLLGVMVDRMKGLQKTLGVSLVLLALGLGLMANNLWLAIVLAASGSALFHVSGGALATIPGQTRESAFFVAPGVGSGFNG